MNMLGTTHRQSFFIWIVRHPKRVVLAGVVFIALMASFVPGLIKDTRSDAFLEDDNPAPHHGCCYARSPACQSSRQLRNSTIFAAQPLYFKNVGLRQSSLKNVG
jgi:hypothetical protein